MDQQLAETMRRRVETTHARVVKAKETLDEARLQNLKAIAEYTAEKLVSLQDRTGVRYTTPMLEWRHNLAQEVGGLTHFNPDVYAELVELINAELGARGVTFNLVWPLNSSTRDIGDAAVQGTGD